MRKRIGKFAGYMVLVTPFVSMATLIAVVYLIFSIKSNNSCNTSAQAIACEPVSSVVITGDSASDVNANESEEAAFTVAENNAETTVNPTPEAKADNLYSMKIVSAESAGKEARMENTIGEELTNVIGGERYYSIHTAFYLGKEYNTLSFDLSCPDSDRITNRAFDIIIYADNDEEKVLYSGEMSRVTARNRIELDVTGVDFVTIMARGNRQVGYIISDSHLE